VAELQRGVSIIDNERHRTMADLVRALEIVRSDLAGRARRPTPLWWSGAVVAASVASFVFGAIVAGSVLLGMPTSTPSVESGQQATCGPPLPTHTTTAETLSVVPAVEQMPAAPSTATDTPPRDDTPSHDGRRAMVVSETVPDAAGQATAPKPPTRPSVPPWEARMRRAEAHARRCLENAGRALEPLTVAIEAGAPARVRGGDAVRPRRPRALRPPRRRGPAHAHVLRPLEESPMILRLILTLSMLAPPSEEAAQAAYSAGDLAGALKMYLELAEAPGAHPPHALDGAHASLRALHRKEPDAGHLCRARNIARELLKHDAFASGQERAAWVEMEAEDTRDLELSGANCPDAPSTEEARGDPALFGDFVGTTSPSARCSGYPRPRPPPPSASAIPEALRRAAQAGVEDAVNTLSLVRDDLVLHSVTPAHGTRLSSCCPKRRAPAFRESVRGYPDGSGVVQSLCLC
jgi:hypothetical protein